MDLTGVFGDKSGFFGEKRGGVSKEKTFFEFSSIMHPKSINILILGTIGLFEIWAISKYSKIRK
jgi:hypothetical protein